MRSFSLFPKAARISALFLSLAAFGLNLPKAAEGHLLFHPMPAARFHFEGFVGERIKANQDQWLFVAPAANPGMIQMFAQRDRKPPPDLVPWAGEFAGKYLISAVQALRLTPDPKLERTVQEVVEALLENQSPEGYLGPFKKEERLRAHWDLWGHYHCMLGLLMWYEATGDAKALQACRRAADLVCDTFLNTGVRVMDAGSHEMNMAIIHVLGFLHRVTAESKYLEMMNEIVRDWEQSGDYLRQGLNGTEFYRTPRPRWESLHDLQGLLELYRITGDTKYGLAFVHHWRSILRWDRRSTGGFSANEQATGDPYSQAPIETCGSVAWMALTLDMLQFTGDPHAADELELSTYNAALGAQHPSGRWWTYNTPMDGVREASADSIVFQARAGAPELNCCSVNGPRSIGMLADWALMEAEGGLVLNFYGPGMFQGKLPDNTPVALRVASRYPRESDVEIRVEPLAPRRFKLRLRIPRWAPDTRVWVNRRELQKVSPGTYLTIERRWDAGDQIEIDFGFKLRVVPGGHEVANHLSVYWGPILLAYDQRLNDFDEENLPLLNPREFAKAKPLDTNRSNGLFASMEPMILMELPAVGGAKVRVCDFSTAGALGTRYRTWMRAEAPPPAPAFTQVPRDNTSIAHGPTLFRWVHPQGTLGSDPRNPLGFQLVISPKADFSNTAFESSATRSNWFLLDAKQAKRLAGKKWYYWKIVATTPAGTTESRAPAARFQFDPVLPTRPEAELLKEIERDHQPLVRASLEGALDPEVGTIQQAAPFKAVLGPSGAFNRAIELDGTQPAVFSAAPFPQENYSLALWANIVELPSERLGQIASAWCGPVDDPVRLCVDKGRLYARIEASGHSFSTEGVPVEAGRWYHFAVIKAGANLSLYVDGKHRSTITVPATIWSRAQDIGIGGNPHFAGNENLRVQVAQFIFHRQPLALAEIRALSQR